MTTLQASLDAADRPVARPLAGTLSLRFDDRISPAAGSRATGDPGVPPDRTLHRLATVSLSLGLASFLSSAPESLGAQLRG